MSEFGRLWKHENKQMHVYPRRRNVVAQVSEELKTVTYATPPMEERRGGGTKNDLNSTVFFD